ncbi:hypothetical protein HDU67_003705 [Dinochytrium kinnereticum]|nr:hypothetical protein HDU67_003705 [Dinochytrium kinnereticum]
MPSSKDAASRERRIIALGALTSTIFVLELVVGYATGSIALVSDSFHMLSDVLALAIGWYAIRLSQRKTYGERLTYGYQRAEILGALTNGVFLIALCFTLIIEAIQRLIEPADIGNPTLVLIVGCVGLVNNVVGLIMFHDHSGHDHNHGHSHGGHKHSHGTHKHSHNLPSNSHDTLEEPQSVNGEVMLVETSSRSDQQKPQIGSYRSDRASSSTSNILTTPTLLYSAQTRAAVMAAAESLNNSSLSQTNESMITQRSQETSTGERDTSVFLSTNCESKLSKVGLHSRAEAGYVAEPDASDHTQSDIRVIVHADSLPATITAINAAPCRDSHDEDLDHGSLNGSISRTVKKAKDGDLNMRSIFLHVAGDALGSVGVVISALVLMFGTGEWRHYVDPIVSLMITGIILHSAIPLVQSASFIMLQVAPVSVPIEKVKREIAKVPGVIAVHDFHVWGLSDSKSVASVHILISDKSYRHPSATTAGPNNEQNRVESEGVESKLEDLSPSYMDIATSVKELLHRYGVHSTTVQPEFVRSRSPRPAQGLVAEAVEGSLIQVDEEEDEVTATACLLRCAEPSCEEASCCYESKNQ